MVQLQPNQSNGRSSHLSRIPSPGSKFGALDLMFSLVPSEVRGRAMRTQLGYAHSYVCPADQLPSITSMPTYGVNIDLLITAIAFIAELQGSHPLMLNQVTIEAQGNGGFLRSNSGFYRRG
jgi:hypothetical protein